MVDRRQAADAGTPPAAALRLAEDDEDARLDAPRDGIVLRYPSDVLGAVAEELERDALEALPRGVRRGLVRHAVHHETDAQVLVHALRALVERISVRERGHLVARDEQQGARRGEVRHGRVGDPGPVVDDEQVVVALERAQRLEEAVELAPRRVRERVAPDPAREEVHARGTRDDRLAGSDGPVEDVSEVVRRREPEQEVEVRETRVEVEQEDPLAARGARDRQVRRQDALADPALSARDADDARGGGRVRRRPVTGAEEA